MKSPAENELKVISLSHKEVKLELIGLLHMDDAIRFERLNRIKNELQLKEILCISTCNRVEFVLNHTGFLCKGQIRKLFQLVNPEINPEQLGQLADASSSFVGLEAFRHLIRVAASLESMVIGEREIITQVRKAFEESRSHKLSGDLIRLCIRKVVEGAKRVYTETAISRKPVSVVSLAWQHFRMQGITKNQRVLLLGAGQVITNFSRFLQKQGYHNVTVVNRSPERAHALAEKLNGQSLLLSDLKDYTLGFDALISCTGATCSVVDESLYRSLLNGETGKKVLIDLALPHDIDQSIPEKFDVDYTGMPQLKTIAERNLQSRSGELHKADQIVNECCTEFKLMLEQRKIELAMQQIPEAIKNIRETATGVVFAKELGQLDDHSRAVLEKVMDYLEKKYISVPMKMAREVMLDRHLKN